MASSVDGAVGIVSSVAVESSVSSVSASQHATGKAAWRAGASLPGAAYPDAYREPRSPSSERTAAAATAATAPAAVLETAVLFTPVVSLLARAGFSEAVLGAASSCSSAREHDIIWGAMAAYGTSTLKLKLAVQCQFAAVTGAVADHSSALAAAVAGGSSVQPMYRRLDFLVSIGATTHELAGQMSLRAEAIRATAAGEKSVAVKNALWDEIKNAKTQAEVSTLAARGADLEGRGGDVSW